MRVFVRTEHAKDIMVLMNWLAEVAALLLVPPVTIGVAELALYRGRIDVAAVLDNRWSGDMNPMGFSRRERNGPYRDPRLRLAKGILFVCGRRRGCGGGERTVAPLRCVGIASAAISLSHFIDVGKMGTHNFTRPICWSHRRTVVNSTEVGFDCGSDVGSLEQAGRDGIYAGKAYDGT